MEAGQEDRTPGGWSDAPGGVQAQAEHLAREGYVVIPGALRPDELEPIRQEYDRRMGLRLEEVKKTNPNPRHVEIKRVLEQDPVFEPLMDWSATFPIARSAIGRDITLASSGEGDYRPGNTPAYISWHNDFQWMVDVPYPRQNFWIRCTYFLEDVTEEMGPFTLLPGSHLSTRPCPAEFTRPDGQPAEVEGMVRITGKAGTCLINNTEIWHTNTPNVTDRPRKLIMILYKHAWMRQWEEGYETTRSFAERQTDPLRQQLCGLGTWHRSNQRWASETR